MKPNKSSFLYDQNHNLLFCRNAKVATSTWLSHFLSLRFPKKKQRLRFFQRMLHLKDSKKSRNATISKKPPKKSEESEISSFDENRIMRSAVPRLFKVSQTAPSIPLLAAASVSFSMVRHPFERLVSAYQDKVMGGTWRENRWAGKLLKRKYKNSSFSAFVQMIVETAGKTCPSPGRRPCRLNLHWQPFVSRCAFCTTPYTVIAKAETSSQDIRYIGYLTNVTFEEGVEMNLSGDDDDAKEGKAGKKNRKRTLIKEESVNMLLKEEESGSSKDTESEKLKLHDEENEKKTLREEEESGNSIKVEDLSEPSPLAAHYFRQVSKEQLKALYSVYRLDFKMFGYSHKSYMK